MMNKDATQIWGLKRDITPCFGARLVQEGNRLHFLADRAGFIGSFSEMQARNLDEAFPHFVAHMELMLLSGELNPRCVSAASVLVRNNLLKLKENYIDSLLDVERVFTEASLKPSLRGVPQITVCDFKNPKRVKNFFSNWGSRKTRLRMHTGTLASWPGFLGAAMLEIRLTNEYLSAAQEKFCQGTLSVAMTDLKVPPIFNAFDNQNTLSEGVQRKLAAYGLRINADTLYRTHVMLRKTTLHILHSYCQLTRKTGVVMSATEDDIWYMSLFIHGDKVAAKQL